jgi:transposase InsO family protein
LEIKRSTYYKYRNTEDSDYELYKTIKNVFEESKGTYGYRRITIALNKKSDTRINEKKIRRVMRKYGIRPKYVKRYKHNIDRKVLVGNVQPDLLKRNFNQEGWVTDITYLVWGNKRAYLSTILDLKTRDVVSYRISRKNDLKLVMDTLNEAISKRKDPNGLILHSDRGFQYTSNEYRNICLSNRIQISHSRKGNPLDNSIIENFHSILKKETLHNNEYTDIKKYIQSVEDWIYFYNNQRIRLKK